MTTLPPVNVLAPARAPRPGSLFSVINWSAPPAGNFWESGGILLESPSCNPATISPEAFYECNGVAQSTLDLFTDIPANGGAPNFDYFAPFSATGYYQCTLTGASEEVGKLAAVTNLLNGAERTVEAATIARLSANATTLGNPPASSVETALREAEILLATRYGSVGVIFINLGWALSLIAERLVEQGPGARFYTALGTPVVATAEIPPTLILTASTLYGARSEPDATSAFEYRKNIFTATAFQSFVVGWTQCANFGIAIEPEATVRDCCGSGSDTPTFTPAQWSGPIDGGNAADAPNDVIDYLAPAPAGGGTGTGGTGGSTPQTTATGPVNGGTPSSATNDPIVVP